MKTQPGPDDTDAIYIGIDIGTSGCRAVAIDHQGQLSAESAVVFAASDNRDQPHYWWQQCQQAIIRLSKAIDSTRVRALAVDGTSATLLMTDKNCRPLGTPLMYNDASCTNEAALIAAIAPEDCAAHGPTSSLAKLLYFQQRYRDAYHVLHQCDWINAMLTGGCIFSDENNALKLGYDIQQRRWPDWFDRLGVRPALLPQVVQPGTEIGTIDPVIARSLGLPETTRVIAGTTDGVASFLATGANTSGDAVTALGSTLVIKLLADKVIFAPDYGVYSHRLGNRWLVGGASNSGGAVLLKYFSQAQLDRMTPLLQADKPTGLHYYPLASVGERFPVNDSNKQPQLTPRPDSDLLYFQALLEGMAAIEARGYELLNELGAPQLKSIRTVGGGAKNHAWTQIRQQRIPVEFKPALQQQAAYGSALLAAGHINQLLNLDE